MTNHNWHIEFYRDEHGREPCAEWMTKKLTQRKRVALETAIELVLANRGLDVVETEYGKALGGGLYEFRLRWSAAEVRQKILGTGSDQTPDSECILLRVFFCTSGHKVILLLCGYDKRRDPNRKRQGEEIAKARKLLRDQREMERRNRG
jgi:hypothetical protein